MNGQNQSGAFHGSQTSKLPVNVTMMNLWFTDGTSLMRQQVFSMHSEGGMLHIEVAPTETMEESGTRKVKVRAHKTYMYPLSRVQRCEIVRSEVQVVS